MEDCNPSSIDTRINFTKREMVGGVILEVMQYQQSPYTIKPIDELGKLLANLPEAGKEMDALFWRVSKSKE